MTTMSEVEEWRPIPGFGGAYEASSLGRIRSYRVQGGRGRRLKAEPHLRAIRTMSNGYQSVGLQIPNGRQRPFSVHGLVAAAFLGPRPAGRQVAHADGKRDNNRIENLRYATPLENAADKHRHGTTCRGETGGRAKLTEAEVRQVYARWRAGERQVDVAAAFNVSQSLVSAIACGVAWAHLNLEAVA